MAQTIVIEQGDKNLNNVTKITPDTRVNQKAAIKYPVTDLNAGVMEESWTEGQTTFVNPHQVVIPEDETGSDGE